MEDEKIIALLFQRSEDAIHQLADKYGRTCHSLSYQILQDRRDAEECVNDAYLGVWNSVPPQRPDPLAAYLCRIVRNLSIKRYHANRATKRNSQYDLALEELDGCIPSSVSVEGELEARELAAYLDQFLAGLPVRDRVLFLRRYWFADSLREAGRRVGITEKNASVRLTRLRKRLGQFLKERGVEV